jgi:ankyrin repeat protein
METAESRYPSAVRLLLDKGSDVNVKSRDGRTALAGVATGTSRPSGEIIDHPEAVLALLTKGADVNAQDSHDRTPLMLAAQSGSTSVVRALRKRGPMSTTETLMETLRCDSRRRTWRVRGSLKWFDCSRKPERNDPLSSPPRFIESAYQRSMPTSARPRERIHTTCRPRAADPGCLHH